MVLTVLVIWAGYRFLGQVVVVWQSRLGHNGAMTAGAIEVLVRPGDVSSVGASKSITRIDRWF